MLSMRKFLLLPLALLLLTTLVYWPGLEGGFLFDDFPNIVTNERIQAKTLTWESLKVAAGAYQPGSYGRPLATISFAIDYAIGGKDPWGYKLTSLFVHLVNTLLVFWLLRRMLALPKVQVGWGPLAAFTIALLWAVHPQQVSSVLYVVQRMETLALTFVLLALIAYLRGRTKQIDGRMGWPWIIGSGLLACVGMLSKETAVLFPAYALGLELTLLDFDARTAQTRKALKICYVTAVLIALAVFFLYIAPAYLAPDAFSGRDFTLYERLLSQLRILPIYLGQMLLPLPSALTFYYDDFAKSTGLLDPLTTLAGGLFLTFLLTMAFATRKRMPLIALGIFWFFTSHLITSNLFNLELAFEHRNYFALLGILLALADLVRRIPMQDGPRLKHFALGAIVIVFGFLGLLRSATWGDPLLLATELVALNPSSPRASNDLATMYFGMADGSPTSPFVSLSAREFERGSLLPNSSPLPEQGLILMAATMGRPVKREWWDRLLHKIETRPISPQEVMAVTGLVTQRYRGIELNDDRLAEVFTALLQRKPTAQLHVLFADYSLTYLHNEDLADHHFAAAVDVSRPDLRYPARVAAALISDGRIRQAKVVLERMDILGKAITDDVDQ